VPAPPTLDAHAHIDARLHPAPRGLAWVGAVLAQTVSLEEAERSVGQREPWVLWGVGCHPWFPGAQAAFTPERFRALLDRTAVVGEVGLDVGSRVPSATQLATFRAVLRTVAERPRMVSIHSLGATREVLAELRRTPVAVPVLHWWKGRAAETSEAVELGCCFSVHAAVARRTTWRTRVPLERILVETDQETDDPPEAIPAQIERVEDLLAEQYGISPEEVRLTVWRNFARIVEEIGVVDLLPPGIAGVLAGLGQPASA